MVRQCQLCKKLDYLNPEKSFHRFPLGHVERQLWCSLLGYEEGHKLPKTADLCSDHFEPEDIYTRINGLKYLRPDATPKVQHQSFLDHSYYRFDAGVEIDKGKEPVAGPSKSVVSLKKSERKSRAPPVTETSSGILTEQTQKRRKNLNTLKERAKKQRTKIHNLQMTVRKLQIKVTSLESSIEDVLKQDSLTSETSESTITMNDANSEFTGKFCWEEIEGVAVPFIIRSSGTMLAEIGMLKKTLFKKHLEVLDDSVFKVVCPSAEELPPRKYPVASLEVKLLDEINILHCDRVFGTSRFSSDVLLLEKEDAVQVYQVLEIFYRAATEKTIDHSKCGYIRIEESKTSVPFVDVSGVGIVVPLFFFECPAAMGIKFELKDHWPLVCLKLFCKMLGVLSTFYDHHALNVVKLEDLMNVFPEIHRLSYFNTLPMNANVSELKIRPKASHTNEAIRRTKKTNFRKKDKKEVIVINNSDSDSEETITIEIKDDEKRKRGRPPGKGGRPPGKRGRPPGRRGRPPGKYFRIHSPPRRTPSPIEIEDDEEPNQPKREEMPEKNVRPLRKYFTNYSPNLPKLAPKKDPEGDTTPDNRDGPYLTTETESSQSNSCEETVQEPSNNFNLYNAPAEQTSTAVASSSSSNSTVSYVYTPTQPVFTPVLGNAMLQPSPPSTYTNNFNSPYIANPQMGVVNGSMGTPAYLVTPGTLAQVAGYGPVMAQPNVTGQQQQTNLSTVTTSLPNTIAIFPQQEHTSGPPTFFTPPTSNLGQPILTQTLPCITQPGCLPLQLGELGTVAQPAVVPMAQSVVVPIAQPAVIPIPQPAAVATAQPALVSTTTTTSSITQSSSIQENIGNNITARVPEPLQKDRSTRRTPSKILPVQNKIEKIVSDAQQKDSPIISKTKLKELKQLLKNKTLQSSLYQVENIPEQTGLKGPLPYTVKKWQYGRVSMVCISISPLYPDTLLINIQEIKRELFPNVNKKVFMAVAQGLNLKIYYLNACQKTAVAMYRKSVGKPNIDEFEEHLYFVLSKFYAAYDLMTELCTNAMQNSFYVCDNFCDHSEHT